MVGPPSEGSGLSVGTAQALLQPFADTLVKAGEIAMVNRVR